MKKKLVMFVLFSVFFFIPFSAWAYVNASTTVCESWRYGDEGVGGYDHWDLQAVNPKIVFSQGEAVTVLSEIESVNRNHRWKVEFWKGSILVWSNESNWNIVGNGWGYSSYYPVLNNVSRGDYSAKIFLDTGNGFNLFSERTFTVEGQPYYSPSAYACSDWRYGDEGAGGYDHWDLQPVNPSTEFIVNSQVCVLSKVSDISENHRWQTLVYRGSEKIISYTSDWNDVGSGWTYSTNYPCIFVKKTGRYNWKVSLDIGGGFVSLLEGTFDVAKTISPPKLKVSHLPAVYKLLL